MTKHRHIFSVSQEWAWCCGSIFCETALATPQKPSEQIYVVGDSSGYSNKAQWTDLICWWQLWLFQQSPVNRYDLLVAFSLDCLVIVKRIILSSNSSIHKPWWNSSGCLLSYCLCNKTAFNVSCCIVSVTTDSLTHITVIKQQLVLLAAVHLLHSLTRT